MDPLKEQELIKGIINNDLAAEKELIDLYYGKIRMIVSLSVNDLEDRKELINDILIGIILKIRDGSFDTDRETSLSNYISGVINKSIYNYLKKLYRRRAREEKYRRELSTENVTNHIHKSEYEMNEEIDQNKKIWRNLIEQLKPKYRNVIFWRYYENMTVAEISRKINIPPQKVSDYLKYAKQLLLKNYLQNK